MSHSEPAQTARRTRSTILAALVAVSAAFGGILGYQSLASSSSSAASPIDALQGDRGPAVTSKVPGRPTPEDRRQHDYHDRFDPPHPASPLGEEDGAVGDGVTVFDDDIPAVANLDPALLDALRHATIDAADDDVAILVSSGWRSPEYQEQLFHDAISEYGSAEEAARWVATADTSAHVSGDAIDIGPDEATAWLSDHGADYGLCQIYGNEPWHYELRPAAIEQDCPAMYSDPTHDPRMQQ